MFVLRLYLCECNQCINTVLVFKINFWVLFPFLLRMKILNTESISTFQFCFSYNLCTLVNLIARISHKNLVWTQFVILDISKLGLVVLCQGVTLKTIGFETSVPCLSVTNAKNLMLINCRILQMSKSKHRVRF